MHDLWLEKIEEKQFDRYLKKGYTNAEAMRLDWKGILKELKSFNNRERKSAQDEKIMLVLHIN